MAKRYTNRNNPNTPNTGKNTGKSSNVNKNSNTGKNTNKNPNANKNTKNTRRMAALVAMAILTAAFLVGFMFEDRIDTAIGLRRVEYYNAGDLVSIGSLNIHFLDIGQGDAAIIELPDNRTMLIDAGGGSSDSANKAAANKIKDYIKQLNLARQEMDRPKIDYFDYVIATHSDADHIGGMAYVLAEYSAAVFYRPNEEATYTGFTDPALNGTAARHKFRPSRGAKSNITYKKAIEAGYAEHTNFIEGIVTNPFDDTQNCINPAQNPKHNKKEEYQKDGDLYYEINFYAPIRDKYGDTEHNNYSPIMLAEYKGRRIALSGDSEEKAEKDFANEVRQSTSESRYFPLKSGDFYADIIKLGHHGSRGSSCMDYLEIMTAEEYIEDIYIVISCGKGNSYGHPHTQTLERLKDIGIKDENILRTDTSGDIYFALSNYAEYERALIDTEGLIIDYPITLLGVRIRYRVIGIAVLALLALILLPTTLRKKAKKFAK